jgi:hypothetical protein
MRPVEFGEALPPGTRLTLFSHDKPDLSFTVMERRFERKMRLPFTSLTVLHSGLTDYNTSVIPYRNQYDHGIVEGGNSGSRKKR